jgi:hypothetical protein
MTCPCERPIIRYRPVDHWQPGRDVTCWTCGGVVPPRAVRLRELSMPPIQPLADIDPYAPASPP